MSHAFKIHKQEATYYLTRQVVDWIDVFTREKYRIMVTNSLNYCVTKKGLTVFAYVVMSNHVHLIANASHANLSNVIGAMKQHTSTTIPETTQLHRESRKEWMLPLFRKAAASHQRNETNQFRAHENHAEEIVSPHFTFQRINYFHQNPVRAGITEKPEDYIYSSARDYAGLKSPVRVEVLNLHLMC